MFPIMAHSMRSWLPTTASCKGETSDTLNAMGCWGAQAYVRTIHRRVKSVQQWVRQGVAGGVIGELLDEVEDYNAIRK